MYKVWRRAPKWLHPTQLCGPRIRDIKREIASRSRAEVDPKYQLLKGDTRGRSVTV